jgi:hypothetical protein
MLLSVTRKQEKIVIVFLTFLKYKKETRTKKNFSSTAPCNIQINNCIGMEITMLIAVTKTEIRAEFWRETRM